MVIPSMENSDADLGYVKMYIAEVHRFLENGGELTPTNVKRVRQIHEEMQRLYIQVNYSGGQEP